MTWGFVASFGGVVLVFVLLLIAERLFFRVAPSTGSAESLRRQEVATSLERAELSLKQVEAEITRARSSLARGT